MPPTLTEDAAQLARRFAQLERPLREEMVPAGQLHPATAGDDVLRPVYECCAGSLRFLMTLSII